MKGIYLKKKIFLKILKLEVILSNFQVVCGHSKEYRVLSDYIILILRYSIG